MTSSRSVPGVAGLLLAAGAGRRFGMAKALVELEGEPLVRRAARVLADGGCAPVVVVLGSRAAEVEALLAPGVRAVRAADWARGMGASLRAGLAALGEQDTDATAALVHLVDLPDVGAEVIARLVAHAAEEAVVRPAYRGVPGHPVLFGRRWWPDIAAAAHGDRGARDWLRGRTDIRLVECGDVGGGADVDTPADLPEHDPP